MKFPKFLLGLIIGVSVGLIAWYWQKSTSAEDGALAVLDRLATAEARVRELEAHLRQMQEEDISTQTADQPIKPEPESTSDSEKPVLKEATEPAKASSESKETVDDLQKISGIGPTFAKRLNDAGILTFNDLSQKSPQNLQEITGLKAWHSADPQDWIDEAKELSES